MKRTLVVLSVVALFLAVACATTATPAVSGVITAKAGNSITVTPNGGTAQTINVSGAHVFWGNGLEAGRADLAVGQPVSVYTNGTTTNANRVVINL